MNQYIAFLRGINLGKRRIKMDALRGHFERMNFRDVTTFIASGNVVFETRIDDASEIELTIERYLERALGYSVDTFVRTRAEIATLAASPLCSATATEDGSHTVNVGLFKTELPNEVRAKLARLRTPVDQFHVTGREYFWLCGVKISESVVWQLPEAKTLALPTTTMRNLKTLRALTELYPPCPPIVADHKTPDPVTTPSGPIPIAPRSRRPGHSPKKIAS